MNTDAFFRMLAVTALPVLTSALYAQPGDSAAAIDSSKVFRQDASFGAGCDFDGRQQTPSASFCAELSFSRNHFRSDFGCT